MIGPSSWVALGDDPRFPRRGDKLRLLLPVGESDPVPAEDKVVGGDNDDIQEVKKLNFDFCKMIRRREQGEFQIEFQREQEAQYLPATECDESCGRLDFGFGASFSCF